jgi:hypothetical protein
MVCHFTCDNQKRKHLAKHPYLSDEINNKIAQSERDGGVWLKNLGTHDALLVRTQNSMYRIVKTGPGDYTIEGNKDYCPSATPCKIHGSTWGGSMLKIGYVGKGLFLEFSTKEHRVVTTSQIVAIETLRRH